MLSGKLGILFFIKFIKNIKMNKSINEHKKTNKNI